MDGSIFLLLAGELWRRGLGLVCALVHFRLMNLFLGWGLQEKRA